MKQNKPEDEIEWITEGLRSLAVDIDLPIIDPVNARRHPEKNLTAIKTSLTSYGQRRPIIINRRTGFVEAGNGTLTAARLLGKRKIAAIYVDDDPHTATGFGIADNRTGELAEWDVENLSQLLREIDTDSDELTQMFATLAEDEGLTLPVEVDFPELSEAVRHTVIVPYEDSDIPALCSFLDVTDLPDSRLGKRILERIKAAVETASNQ